MCVREELKMCTCTLKLYTCTLVFSEERSCTRVDVYAGGTETAYMYTVLFQNTTQVYM